MSSQEWAACLTSLIMPGTAPLEDVNLELQVVQET